MHLLLDIWPPDKFLIFLRSLIKKVLSPLSKGTYKPGENPA